MTESRKHKIIKKQPKTISSSSVQSSPIGNRKILKCATQTYKIHPTPLYINETKKSLVYSLTGQDGKDYVGKFIRTNKQIQVLLQIYYLDLFKNDQICKMVDLVKVNQGFWIISEKGHQTLYSYMEKLKSEEIQTILRNIATSYLGFYKKNIAHRDLKPSNIIIDQRLEIKFIDLQLCEKNDYKHGTMSYLPPEIKAMRWDSQDVYAYGIIAKQMCMKCKFDSKQLEMLIVKCAHPNQSKRWGWNEIYQFWGIQFQSDKSQLSESETNSLPEN